MGTGLNFVCKKCRFSFEAYFGIGFLFPEVYEKAIKDGMEGKLGLEVQSFLQEHPDGALDCDRVLLQCTDCGNLETDMDYSMYVPKDIPALRNRIRSAAYPYDGVQYIMPGELEENYVLYSRYNHVCRKCGGRMRNFTEEDIVPGDKYAAMRGKDEAGVPCPKCGRPLRIGGVSMWD